MNIIFYIKKNSSLKANTMVLLHAYKKQSQKAPIKEIKTAEQRLLEVLKHEKDYA